MSAPSSFPRPADALAHYLHEVVGSGVDEALLVRALTHRSYAYEHGGLPNNERLEFLGDAVLGLVVTDTLYRTHPDLPEGQLAKLRAAVVNMRALADVARTIDLGGYVFLGRGEEATGGRDKASILADTMEAVIGTIHLACGIEAAGSVRPPPLRPAHDPVGHPRRGPGLEDEPAGAGGRRQPRHPGVCGAGVRPRPREAVRRPRPRRRRGAGARHRPEQEGGRAAGGRAGVGRPRRPTRPDARSSSPRSSDHGRRLARVPELPEVETVRRGLDAHVVGRRIASAELRGTRVARRHVPGADDLAARVAGNRVVAARRRGKYLWLVLEAPDGHEQALLVHLGMSGQLLVQPPEAPDEKHLHARFAFADGGAELRFVDQRTFGGVALAEVGDGRHPRRHRAHRARPPRARVRRAAPSSPG